MKGRLEGMMVGHSACEGDLSALNSLGKKYWGACASGRHPSDTHHFVRGIQEQDMTLHSILIGSFPECHLFKLLYV